MRTFQRRRRYRAAVDPIITRPNRPAKGKAWSEEQMAEAMECATSGTTSINKAAELYGVPKTTFIDCLSGRVIPGSRPGPKPYLQSSEETELACHLLGASSIGLGKTRYEVMRIAEGVARSKGVLRGGRISHGWWDVFKL